MGAQTGARRDSFVGLRSEQWGGRNTPMASAMAGAMRRMEVRFIATKSCCLTPIQSQKLISFEHVALIHPSTFLEGNILLIYSNI